MRRAFRSAGLTTLLVALTACGGGRDEVSTASAPGEEKVLHVFNWADYIGESTIADFEARTGIKVTYDVFDTDEILTTKLLTGGSGYDVIVPSGAMTYHLHHAGVLRKLDKSKLKNLGNMDPRIMRIVTAYDLGNEHALPYLWGTTGIGYNPDLVEKALGTRSIDSLSAVFDPAIASKLAKCGITMLSSQDDMFFLALIYLGLDPNSERPEDLTAAETVLRNARPYVRSFSSSGFLNDLATGEVCVSVGWSGSVRQARSRGAQAAAPVTIEYVIPKEGSAMWFDMIAIPADAPHPENAYAFLDYIMEPEVIAGVTNVVEQANGNAASVPYVSPALRNDSLVYPTSEMSRRLTVVKPRSPEKLRETSRMWTRIQTGE